MHILIIGGTRFIGPYVVRRLVVARHRVTLFNRGQTACENPDGVEVIKGDRADLIHDGRLSELADRLRAAEPEVVLDMIPIKEQDARDLLAVFDGVARRVVAVSSQDVYRNYGRFIEIESGPPDPVPLTEDSPLRGKLYPYRDSAGGPEDRMYHYDKIPVERAYLSEPKLPGTILRYPMVYGPGDYQHRLYGYLKRMDDDRPSILLDRGMAAWRWTRGYVEDIASATVQAIVDDRAAGRVYNLGERDSPCEADWVRVVAGVVGWDGRVVAVAGEKLPESMRVSGRTECHIVTDTSRIREELGFVETVPRDEGLRRTIAWERANPPSGGAGEFDYGAEDAVLADLGK